VTDSQHTPPAGFGPIFRTSPFLDSLGTFYSKGVGADMVLGVFLESRATNARGAAHGGFLAGLADVALGYAMSSSETPSGRFVTSALTLNFAGSAQLGDWIEAHVDIQRLGRQLGFAQVYLWVKDKRIVHASGTFLRVAEAGA
jgi:acyl-coenzyme A thioesterase 13